MSSFNLVGNDTISINSRNLADFADGKIGSVTFPNKIASIKTGKNGNSIIAQDTQGFNGELELRMMMGSADDIFLTNLLALQQANLTTFVMMSGQLVKNVGDGSGNLVQNVYQLQGGTFSHIPEVESDVAGNTDQGVVVWKLQFTFTQRTLT